jgi:hypothetical protein
MFATAENNQDLERSSDSALCSVDRSNLAVSQGFDIPHGRQAEETAVLALNWLTLS